MLRQIPLGTSLQLAVVRSVSKTFVECCYLSKLGEEPFQCPYPHPYAGQGGGVLVGIERNTIVLTAKGPAERPYILAVIPDRKYFFDNAITEDIPYNTSSFPELQEGEILLKSSFSGAYVDVSPSGNVKIDAGIGDALSNIELSKPSESLFLRNKNIYSFTDAERRISGVVKRDKSKSEKETDSKVFRFLDGEAYDELLTHIGRSPTDEVHNRSTKISRDTTRNPALVENRQIVYEYANSFGVRDIDSEVTAMERASKENDYCTTNLEDSSSARKNRRTDILNLNMQNFNHLIEKVEGTVVDIYGNVLDINRSVINIPDTSVFSTQNQDVKKSGESAAREVKKIYNYMRRSIKYHFEINSRKDEYYRNTNIEKISQRDHSRWSIDVDGEGLTKINIPASSNTGNIPILARHLTSIDKDNEFYGGYRSDNKVDVQLLLFGSKGQTINDSAYVRNNINNKPVSYGTAYHDISKTALNMSSNSKFAKGDKIASNLNNIIGDTESNAGGRSVFANLDGSATISIGSDNSDGRSLYLDLQGGMMSHYGCDLEGRSIIHQSDGTVIVQIGGTAGAINENGNNTLAKKNGRLEIHLMKSGLGGGAQKIIIDEQGMTIDISGNVVIASDGDMTIGAGGRLLLAGELIFNYGSYDKKIDGTRAPLATERLVLRNGIPDHM